MTHLLLFVFGYALAAAWVLQVVWFLWTASRHDWFYEGVDMDVRRLNDMLKIVGAVVASLALFGPVLQHAHESTGSLIGDILAVLPGAIGAFAAGMGTRGIGLEYKDVAEAKAIAKIASMAPPPPSERPTIPSVAPVKI